MASCTTLLAPELMAGPLDTQVTADEPVCLAAGRCDSCGRHVFPAMERCPVDGTAMATVALSATAHLRGHTSVLAPPPEVQLPVPYHVGTAEFPEGVVVIGLLLAAPTEMAIGDELEVVAHPVDERLTFAFRPTGRR